MAKRQPVNANGEIAGTPASEPKPPKLTKGPAPVSGGEYKPQDPDLGQRPYHDHELDSMANHVKNATEIMSHPVKSKAVFAHLQKQGKIHKAAIKSFSDLQGKIGADMTS